jgi:hypothetical protein
LRQFCQEVSPQGVYVFLVRKPDRDVPGKYLLVSTVASRPISRSCFPLHQQPRLPTVFQLAFLPSNMPPVQGTGKAPNIANPNLPPTAPSSKAPSVAGSTAPTESAAVVAKDDPAKAIEKLEIRTKAVNTNNVARVANSHLTTSDAKLHPLVSLRNGKPLDKFPETSAGLVKLTCKSPISFSFSLLCWGWLESLGLCCVFVQLLMRCLLVVNVDQMLNALDAERSGSEAMKRERLRVQIGLRPNPA